MFKQNKYFKWYYALIDRAKQRINIEIFERHHIIPKSIGGDDYSDNLVNLTYREHYICHLLLIKMTTGANRKKMSYALTAMKMRILKTTKFNSHLFNKLKTEANQHRSHSMKGRLFTEQHRRNISLNHVNRVGSNNTFFGKRHSEESKQKIGSRDYSNQTGSKSYQSKKVRINGCDYDTITEASLTLGIPFSTVSRLS